MCIRDSRYRVLVLSVLTLLLLNDNILWTINLLRKKEKTEWEGHLSQPTREMLQYLSANSSPADLLIGNATLVNYLANVYSPANAWISHPYNTPDIPNRQLLMDQFLAEGRMPEEWKGRKVLLIIDRNAEKPAAILPALKKNILFENTRYQVFTP